LKTTIISLALGIVLASPVAAYATEPVSGSAPSHQATDFWQIGLPGLFARPTTGAGAKAHAAKLRTEGLSRNPNVCAKYGCLGY
jgi:hypothetical protein